MEAKYSVAISSIVGEWYPIPVLSFCENIPLLPRSNFTLSIPTSSLESVTLPGLLIQALCTFTGVAFAADI